MKWLNRLFRLGLPHCIRMSVKLKPGEEWIGCYDCDPPDGYRWETDDELRQRILEGLKKEDEG